MDKQTKGPVQQQSSPPAEQERPENLYYSLLPSPFQKNKKSKKRLGFRLPKSQRKSKQQLSGRHSGNNSMSLSCRWICVPATLLFAAELSNFDWENDRPFKDLNTHAPSQP
jgi:hypothetical protein